MNPPKPPDVEVKDGRVPGRVPDVLRENIRRAARLLGARIVSEVSLPYRARPVAVAFIRDHLVMAPKTRAYLVGSAAKVHLSSRDVDAALAELGVVDPLNATVEAVALPAAPALVPDGAADELLRLLAAGPTLVVDLAGSYQGPGGAGRSGRPLVDVLWSWLVELQRQGRVTYVQIGSPPILHWSLPPGHTDQG